MRRCVGAHIQTRSGNRKAQPVRASDASDARSGAGTRYLSLYDGRFPRKFFDVRPERGPPSACLTYRDQSRPSRLGPVEPLLFSFEFGNLIVSRVAHITRNTLKLP